MADAKFLSMLGWQGPQLLSGATNHSLDANNDGVGWVFQANTADQITHLGYRYGARNGTPPTYIIGLEGVSASTGAPDGTYLGGGSPASKTFTPPADTSIDGTWVWQQLTNAFTPTRGQLMAVTIRYSSGTIDGSNFSTFTRADASGKGRQGFPYPLTLTAGTWAKVTGAPMFGYRTANGRYGCILPNSTTPGVTTSGNRSAMHFTLPSGHGSTFKLAGINGLLRATAGGSFILGLWNAAGAVIQDITLDTDQFETSGVNGAHLFFDESALTALNHGTKYYVGVECVATVNTGLSYVQLAEAADRSAFPNGTNIGYATWDGATWTEDNTIVPLVELILADITVPAGGGGVLVVGGMHGGMQRT